jgi:hypothetical protein
MPQQVVVVAGPPHDGCLARRIGRRADRYDTVAARRLPENATGEETLEVPNDCISLHGPVRCGGPPRGVGPVRREGEPAVLLVGNGSRGAFGYVRVPSLRRDLTSANRPPATSEPRRRAPRGGAAANVIAGPSDRPRISSELWARSTPSTARSHGIQAPEKPSE